MKEKRVESKVTLSEIRDRFESGDILGFRNVEGKRFILFVNSSGTLSYRKGRSKRLGFLLREEDLEGFYKFIKK